MGRLLLVQREDRSSAKLLQIEASGKGSLRMTAAAAAAIRSLVLFVVATMLCLSVMGTRVAHADAIEGEKSYLDGRKDEAIAMLRRAAWQDNDFFAQYRLGEIYSAKRADDKGYEDRVEAFVWYYMASRNPNIVEHLNVDGPAQAMVEFIAGAERESRKIYATLLQDERIDVRNRLIYIQSCLGGPGMLRIGMYYDPNIAEVHESGALQSSGASRPIVHWFQQGFAPRNGGGQSSSGTGPSAPGDGPLPVGRWAADMCRESVWWGWIFGNPLRCQASDPVGSSSAVFPPSTIEALMYYYLAQRGHHPLASKYMESLKASADSPAEGVEADQIAKGKAKRWLSPFEYYASESRERGETQSGLVHSDQCPVNLERAKALAVADRTISPEIRMDMLKFLNFNRGDGMPASVPVKKFQDFLGEDTTGVLTAMQTVRLFQISATRGYVRAQRCLGIMYLKGIGFVKNAVRAEKWLLTAANQGDGEAMYALSELYSLGSDGVEKLEDKANRYRQGAAIAGFTPVKAEFLRLLDTAPVRAVEQAKPEDTVEPETKVEDPPAREPRRREPRRHRVRRTQPQSDDGPFGE